MKVSIQSQISAVQTLAKAVEDRPRVQQEIGVGASAAQVLARQAWTAVETLRLVEKHREAFLAIVTQGRQG